MCVDGAASMVRIKTELLIRIKIDFHEVESIYSVVHRLNPAPEYSINCKNIIELKKYKKYILNNLIFSLTFPKNTALLAETHIKE